MKWSFCLEKSKQNWKSDIGTGTITKLIYLCIVVAAFWLASVLVYYWHFRCDSNDPFTLCVPSTKEEWGQFGDYIGGLLNPIFGSLTFILVLISVYLQRIELKTVSEEIALLRRVQQEGLNRKHYEYILNKCSKENSDFNTNIISFIDSFASEVKIPEKLKNEELHKSSMISFFSLVANETYKNCSLGNMLDIENGLDRDQQSLSLHINSIRIYIHSIIDQIHDLKSLGCPRYMIEDLLNSANDLVEDFHLSQSGVFRRNMKIYIVDLSVLNNVILTYPEYPSSD